MCMFCEAIKTTFGTQIVCCSCSADKIRCREDFRDRLIGRRPCIRIEQYFVKNRLDSNASQGAGFQKNMCKQSEERQFSCGLAAQRRRIEGTELRKSYDFSLFLKFSDLMLK